MSWPVVFLLIAVSGGAVYFCVKLQNAHRESVDDDIEMDGNQRTRIRHEAGL